MADLIDLHMVQSKREAHIASMVNIGVSEEFISELVETFYQRIRADERLGPIFDQEIGDNWDPHLAKMKTFWSTIILKSNTYSGRPVPAHQKLVGVRPGDFTHWLSLFEKTLIDLAPSAEVTEAFMENAKRIATRLESVVELDHSGQEH